MTTETIEEFLARGGSIEKSTVAINLTELLQKEGMLGQDDAENLAKDLGKALNSSLDKLGSK
jgi:hypothetical protein